MFTEKKQLYLKFSLTAKKYDFYKFERRIYPESMVHHQEFKVLCGVSVSFLSRYSFEEKHKYSKKIKNNL